MEDRLPAIRQSGSDLGRQASLPTGTSLQNRSEACWPNQGGCLTSIDETEFSLCARRRCAIDPSLDENVERAVGDYRRGRVVRLRLYARAPKAAGSAAATHRRPSSSSGAITRENIRPNIFDREKHGGPDRLSCIARGKSRGPDLSRLSALRHGRPNKITRQSSPRIANTDSICSGNAGSALPPRLAQRSSPTDDSAEFAPFSRRRRPFFATNETRTGG